jgi:anti-sigma B factor antagonist
VSNQPSEFVVHIEHGADSVILRPVGEMDIASQPRWHAAVTAATARPYRAVIVDMAGVSFMDPGGLNCLIDARRGLHTAGIELSIVNPGARVQRVCAMVGVFDHSGESAR